MSATNRATVAHGRTLATRTVSKAWNDRILGLSAETAFWQLLSLPSLFLAVLGALGFVARLFGPSTVARAQTQLLNGFGKAFSPEVVTQLVAPTVRQVLRGGRADIVSVGFLLALWAGSSATATFVNTITIAYGMRDLRGAVRSRLLALVAVPRLDRSRVDPAAHAGAGSDPAHRRVPDGRRATPREDVGHRAVLARGRRAAHAWD